ncbi:hypothetical protein Thiofri_02467 [Thiorhodovibrio frisius]|nr:putative inorganic carbon transporter subunit DabA [Thiorhodovibrio frisius]WPL22307.1 hypothetical protein Thiofri_02467 [Thiorhodovibrio frisius]
MLEGNAGDLRVGLPMQSLHDGKQWIHEPMRRLPRSPELIEIGIEIDRFPEART